ncbi:(Fe-S)-binding protein [Actinomycetospora straminea]|uniref:Glycolate oxidase iron-sulfur subunit n=1 Tax=Actinomycetospora straminea TaxID=663607 RepID=A0ABP9EWH9_9PSEU|nr:heterodisulfide reductase-related iron-sulfur binding cluster [Actinomycetospora straminea]MDD7931789.1 heterodisulfide reductase-related iron-sulfur binding cluster [Actinomycetospora straminea]
MTTHPTTGPSPDFSSERGEKPAPERADVLGGEFGSFDDHHPPAQELLDDCVHCGFCLPTCPTYALWGEEMDSPRGRIYLMEMAEKGEIPLEGAFTTHIDRCLGCMACVTACPSGVQYDRLLEATRPQIERNVARSRSDRLFREAIFALFPYKRRLRAASIGGALYQKLRPKSMDRLMARLPERFSRLVAMESLLPPVSVREAFARIPARTPAVGPRRGRVGLLTGCVQDVFFHPVNEATVRVLAAEGWDVIAPREQTCCGALGLHAGREEEAIARAKKLIATFERARVDTIATNVAGCGSSMKEYGELLADDPEWADRAQAFAAKVRDISEVVDETLADPRARRHPIEATVVYHDACHLGHAQKIRTEPRRVLRAIPGVELVELPEAEICCGSAGIYNMLQPQAAGDLGRRKADNIRGTGADVLVTANPGCLLQIRKYLDGELPMLHPIQLVDASIRGVRPPEMG